MTTTDNEQWVLSVCAKQAPSFDKVCEILEGKGVNISPRDYIAACKSNNLNPDIDPVFIKIAESTVTADDVNLVLEDVVDAVRERIMRRVRKSVTKGHITHGGKQRLGGERMDGRVKPKRDRSDNTQKHGRGTHGHDKSTKRQRAKAKSSARNGSVTT